MPAGQSQSPLKPLEAALFLLPLMLLFVIFFVEGFSLGMILEGRSSFLLELNSKQALRLSAVVQAIPKLNPEPGAAPNISGSKIDEHDIRQRERGMLGSSSLTYSHRINWATAAALEALAVLASLCVCLFVLTRTYRTHGIRHPFLLAALALIALEFSVFLVLGPAAIQGPVHDLLAVTVNLDVEGIIELWDALDASAFIAAVLIAMTVSMILIVPPKETPDTTGQLLALMHRLRLLLYAGMVLLVLNVLQFSLLLGWVEAHLLALDDVAPVQLEGALSALVSTRAVFLTLVLLAIYAPGALYVQQRSRKHATIELKTGAGESEITGWLKKKGFAAGPLEVLPRLLALLAPFIAGAVYDLFKELAK